MHGCENSQKVVEAVIEENLQLNCTNLKPVNCKYHFVSIAASISGPVLHCCWCGLDGTHTVVVCGCSGGRYKSWKRRWFILNDNCLYYFQFTTVSIAAISC